VILSRQRQETLTGLESVVKNSYVASMSDKVTFSGKVVRIERDGFAVIHFDQPLGPSANSYGLISSSTGTTSVPYPAIIPGVKVIGTAEPSDRDLASIKTITVIP